MKIKLLAFFAAVAMCVPVATNADGWGKNQTRGTLKGAFWGTIIGGVTGHQSGKRDEGMIAGALIGSFIGNKSGEGKDDRRLRDSRYDRYNSSRDLLYRRPGDTRNYNRGSTDPEVLAAQQRAEAIEREVAREKALILAAQEKERQLIDARKREEAALKELQSLRRK